ncbi:hypothetical protein EDB82DRAFT_98571 [Fusarium venenatum]|uniref:uncharacterized protein n=1 Tax=Fusarium venenatum TaxID=56646 RepID=UPI001D84AD32|nr:hypothetical protein EDB82DRAFT_98571 [Fusarium venenatum]
MTTESITSVEENISIKAAPTNTESESASQTSSTDNGANSPSTPIGPIVGGVIGGLALIAFIGFGLWFVFRKNHNRGTDTSVYTPANYHSPSQSLPSYGYINHTSPDPQYNHPPMSSTPRDTSQNFSNLPHVVSPQHSELPSTPGRPRTLEM